MNIPFKGCSRLGRSLHGWQSSYATDCRSVDPGANPGPCSRIIRFIGYSMFSGIALHTITQSSIMAGSGGILTITIIGACAFLILVALNMIFFLNQDKGVLDWLKHATSKQRIIAIIDGIVTFFCALDFLHILLIFLI